MFYLFRYNMQKVTYVLLQRHANSYWQTERDDDLRSIASPAKRRRPATICAVSEGKEPYPGLNDMMSKLADREKKNAPHMTPGIQHHALPSQSSVSRPPSHTVLRPILPDLEDDNPPPVPPKPIVIRADQIFDSNQQQWQFTPVQQRRQTMW